MRSIAVLTIVAIACACAVVRSLPDQEAYADPVRTKQIHGISLAGEALPVAALREVLETRLGEVVDTGTLERDRLALEHALADRGYLAAQVAPPVVTFDAAGGALIVFDIERGPLYHVRQIILEGGGWPDAGVLPLASGDVASRARLLKVRDAARATLARHGRALEVELALDHDHADAMIDVRYSTR